MFTKEQMKELVHNFQTIDANGDGYIDLDELQFALDVVGIKLPAYEIRKIIDELKKDEGGSLTFEEFSELYSREKRKHGRKFSKELKQMAGVEIVGSQGGDQTTVTDIKHTIREEEQVAFAHWINTNLESDSDLSELLPLDASGRDLYEKVGDGLIICKLINLAVPGTIDETQMKKGAKLNVFTKPENLTLALNSARDIGCKITNIDAGDLMKGKKHLVLGILWQIIRIGLLNKIDLVQEPGLVRLLHDDETMTDMQSQSEEQILMRWVNYQMEKAGVDRRMNNFSTDIMDSELYTRLMKQIAPVDKGVGLEPLELEGNVQRAEAMLLEADKLDCRAFVTADDVANGVSNLNLAFVANLFNTWPGFIPSGESETVEVKNQPETVLHSIWDICVSGDLELMKVEDVNYLRHYELKNQSAFLSENTIFGQIFDSTAFESLLPTFHRAFELSLQISSEHKQRIINNVVALFIAWTGRSGGHIVQSKDLHRMDLLLPLADQCNNDITRKAIIWYIQDLMISYAYKANEIVSIAKEQKLEIKRVGNEGIYLPTINAYLILQSLADDSELQSLDIFKGKRNPCICLVEAGALGSFFRTLLGLKWSKVKSLSLELTEEDIFNLSELPSAPTDRCSVRNLTLSFPKNFEVEITLQLLFEQFFTFIYDFKTVALCSSVLENKFTDLSNVFGDKRMRGIEDITLEFITIEDAANLNESLKNYDQLVHFRMEQCIMESDALLSIFTALKECPKVRDLHLIALESAKADNVWNEFCALLPQFKELKTLWLSDNSLSSSQIDTLIEYVPDLHDVDFSGNDIRDHHMKALEKKQIYVHKE